MKPITSSPSTSNPMHFFTPELYLQGNSSNDELVDQAETAWREATAAYREYLRSVDDRLSNSVRTLAKACFHDAEVLDAVTHHLRFPPAEPLPFLRFPTFTIFVKDDRGRPACILYLLWSDVRRHAPPAGWPFPSESRYWLYEELEVAPQRSDGWFKHKILLSTGEVLDIPFVDVFIMGPGRKTED